MGAHVIVIEVDPLRALEAVMDGFQVMPIAEAARVGDVFITATGDVNVIRKEHMRHLKDGAILANTGHFNVELDLPGLAELADGGARGAAPGAGVRDARRAAGLRAGRGAPAQPGRRRGPPGRGHGHELRQPGAQRRVPGPAAPGRSSRGSTGCPREIDAEIARVKLETMGVSIDTLTAEQRRYLASWDQGT